MKRLNFEACFSYCSDSNFFSKLSSYKTENFQRALKCLQMVYPYMDSTLLSHYFQQLTRQKLITPLASKTTVEGTIHIYNILKIPSEFFWGVIKLYILGIETLCGFYTIQFLYDLSNDWITVIFIFLKKKKRSLFSYTEDVLKGVHNSEFTQRGDNSKFVYSQNE